MKAPLGITVLVLVLASISAAIVLTFVETSISPAAVEGWELAGAIVGGLLWGVTAVEVGSALADYRAAHAAGTAGVYTVARRLLTEAVCRFLGKSCLAATLIAIYGARHWHGLLVWLQRHPLAVFLLIFDAMLILTLNGFFAFLWRANFIRDQKRENGSGGNHS